MAYTTIQQVKQYLGISATTDDALIKGLVDRAQAVIDAYCHRSFEASADTTRTLDAVSDVDGDTLWLDADLCAITSVTNGDSVVVTASQYVTEPRNSLTPYYGLTIRSDADIVWTYSTYHENAISIVGKWAYSTTAPDDIVHATIRLTAFMYNQKNNMGDLDRPVVAGDITILPATMPADLKLILGPYRKAI